MLQPSAAQPQPNEIRESRSHAEARSSQRKRWTKVSANFAPLREPSSLCLNQKCSPGNEIPSVNTISFDPVSSSSVGTIRIMLKHNIRHLLIPGPDNGEHE